MKTTKELTGFTREELNVAFTKVQNPAGWKYGHENFIVEAADLKVTEEAVIYFTGGVMKSDPTESGRFVCNFEGYYTCVGA